jgi:hypothetical protein
MRSPLHYFLFTVLVALSCGFIFWILQNTLKFSLAPLIVIVFGLLVVLEYIRYLLSFDWTCALSLHRFAITVDTLAPFVFFSYMQEIDNTRVDDTTGMALVGTIFLIGLLVMFRSLRAPYTG